MTPARNATNSAGHVRTSVLDLDELEREDGPGPFTFVLGGRSYELASPEDLDYRDLAEAMVAGTNGDLVGALNTLLDEEDRSEFWANRIPAFKMEALVRGFMEHYRLEEGN